MADDPEESNRGRLAAAVLLIALAGGGGWLWMARRAPASKKAKLFGSRAEDAARPRGPEEGLGPRGPAAPAIQGVVLGDLASNEPPAPPPKKSDAETAFRDAALRGEEHIRTLGRKYTDKYAVIRQYGEDWVSYPDLKKLRDDFWKDKNPAQFMRGLAKSENFPKLAKKYITSPEIHEFIREAITQAPADLFAAASGFLSSEPSVNKVVSGVAKEMGISQDMLDGKKPADAPVPKGP